MKRMLIIGGLVLLATGWAQAQLVEPFPRSIALPTLQAPWNPQWAIASDWLRLQPMPAITNQALLPVQPFPTNGLPAVPVYRSDKVNYQAFFCRFENRLTNWLGIQVDIGVEE